MRTTTPSLRNSVFILLAVLAFTSLRASAQTKPVAARVVRAVDDQQTVTLKGNVHPLARAEFDRGMVDTGQPVGRMLLLLKRSTEQEAALRQLIDEQQTKSSTNFHAWLTPEQFGQQFGPADSDVQAVTSWLTGQGFSGVKVGPGRTVVEFSGTTGQVQTAFHTQIHNFAVNGKERVANASDPQIPVALAPVIAGVVSLNSFPKRSHSKLIGHFQRNGKNGEVHPLFSGTSGGSPFYAIGPGDFAKIYNIPSSLDGTGQTIAIVGRTNIDEADVQAFRAFFGLPANFTAADNIILNGPDPGIVSTDEEGEADLDVQWSGAVAPKATIKLVVSETPQTGVTDGIDLSAIYIVDNNIAPVMSESFGTCEAGLGSTGNAFYNALWEQAAAQGITVLLSTGDNGAAGCDDFTSQSTATGGIAISGLASTPFNVAVGGTEFNDAGTQSTYFKAGTAGDPNDPVTRASAKSYIPEIPWNDSCAATGIAGCTGLASTSASLNIVGGSGGQSTVYAKPPWQTGTGVPAANHRYIPDVSLFASDGQNSSFYVTCQADSAATPADSCATTGQIEFQGVGGTSASSPAFAGIMALINQSQVAGGHSGRQGNANYVLYKLAAASGASCTSNVAAVTNTNCVFYDVASGNNAVACSGGSTANCSASTGFGVLIDPANPSSVAWAATPGYDRATGLGSVNVANLATAWPTASFTATNVTLTLPSTAVHGSIVNFTVGVSGGATGPVTLLATSNGGAVQSVGPFELSAGTVSASTTLLPGGSPVSVVAQYGGDGTHGASNSTAHTITITKESSQVFVNLVGNSGTITTTSYGSPYILRVDVTNSGGFTSRCSLNLDNGTVPPVLTIPCPTGFVTLTDNGAPLNDFPNSNAGTTSNRAALNALGFYEDQPIQLGGGSHSLVATYEGDSSFTGSASAASPITITLAQTQTTLTGPASVPSGGSVTYTATIATASNGAGPTGTVQFKNGATALGAAVVCTPAAATATVAASCTAHLVTNLSFLAPLETPKNTPPNALRIIWMPLLAMLAFLVLALRFVPSVRARRFVYAAAILLFCMVVGIAGCGGGSSGGGGGGGSHTASITATYGGDANYSGSTSNAVSVTIQ